MDGGSLDPASILNEAADGEDDFGYTAAVGENVAMINTTIQCPAKLNARLRSVRRPSQAR